MTKPTYSSKDNGGSGEWATPDNLFRVIDHIFGPFDLDPCASDETAKAPTHFTWKEDGLAKNWNTTGVRPSYVRAYMNPPYGKGINLWIEKMISEVADGNIEVGLALLPVRSGSPWWQHLVMQSARDIWLLQGRVIFDLPGGKNLSAPFASALVRFDRASVRMTGGTVVTHAMDWRSIHRGIEAGG